MLYLVATPIGNLSDISQRALDTLSSSDYILCEDTRHTLPLLTHFNIKKPLHSFHKFNESFKEENIIDDLKSGKILALVSDAGTPGISDPGSQLVQRCIQENIRVISIPGPCAAITAITCSGLDTNRFQFFGFLPKKKSELKKTLQEILEYSGTTICYESPFRLLEVLQEIEKLDATRQLVVARELTKKFEELHRGTSKQQIEHWSTQTLKGEIVLLISGRTNSTDQNWEELTPEEHVHFLEKTYQLSRQEAIKMAAKMRGVPKRSIYNTLVNKE